MSKDSYALTVENVMKAPDFKHAAIIAGHRGLNKIISWAHILEVTDCRDYVNGNELILTTGVGWKKETDPVTFIQNLIDKNVTALCIQLGSKFNCYRTADDLPPAMIEAADNANFPLVIFPEEHDCRYVDLLKNLHAMIINNDYSAYVDQEKFLNQLYLLLINHHDTDDILYFIHNHLKINVAFKPIDGPTRFVPGVDKNTARRIDKLIAGPYTRETIQCTDCCQAAMRSVNACNQDLGHLVLYSKIRPLDHFDHMVLDKCSLTLAQEFISNLYLKEKERFTSEQWVNRWLNGKMKNHEVLQQLQEVDPDANPEGCLACLVNYAIPFQNRGPGSESVFHITGISRTILDDKGFSLYLHHSRNATVFLLANQRNRDTWKPRLTKALYQISELIFNSNFHDQNKTISFFIGTLEDDLAKICHSLEKARETQYIKNNIAKRANINFYDDLHVYRLVMLLEKQSTLIQFVCDYLKPLLDENLKPNPILLNTLIALRDCQYNKKEAADQLYIARQSLYQRVHTLENLLGKDFISTAEKRVCLEIALYGLEFLGQDCKRQNPRQSIHGKRLQRLAKND